MRYLLILILLSGCSANWHLTQAKKKGVNMKVDTVYKTIEVVTERYELDTLLQVKNIHDTIRFENERVKWRTKYDTLNKTVFVDVECKPDTVIKKVPISVNNEVKPDQSKNWQKYLIGFVIGVMLIAVIFIFKK